MPKLIKNWSDLVGLENDKYKLEIDLTNGCGWIRSKKPEYRDRYLTNHIFYVANYRGYSELLQSCGFDIELSSWSC